MKIYDTNNFNPKTKINDEIRTQSDLCSFLPPKEQFTPGTNKIKTETALFLWRRVDYTK